MMDWFNRSIRNKLMAIIAAGVIAIVLASIASFKSASTGLYAFDELVNQDVTNERLVSHMLIDFKTQVQEWKNTLLRGYDDQNRQKYWQRFQNTQTKIQRDGAELLKGLDTGEAQSLVSQFLAAHQRMGIACSNGFDQFSDSGYDYKSGDAAVQGIDREPSKLLAEAAKGIELGVAEKSALVSEQAHGELNVFAGILMAVIVVFACVSMLVINRAIVTPSKVLINVISRISKGQLNNTIDIQREDELGNLARASQALQDFLLDMSQGLVRTDGSLRQASEQLESSSQVLVDKITTANESTDHIASAMTEMSATAQDVSGHAASAAGIAQEADAAAKDGVQTMAAAQSSINQLASQISDTVAVVHRLEEDSAHVGTVLSVIRGIAEQTNLLALNAAIEAARAGEQGRGFAVVADEVRSLAQKTQQSTTEIEDIIESVQTGAKNTAEVMNASSKVTADSADMFNQASEKLDVISNSISQINGLNMQVATAAEQQTNVSEDIARTVVEMSDIVEATTQSANQSYELSQQLAGEAQSLSQLASSLQHS